MSHEPLRCFGCGKPYKDFPLDIVLPDNQWADIAERTDGGGVLCAGCIIERASKLPGITVAKMVLE